MDISLDKIEVGAKWVDERPVTSDDDLLTAIKATKFALTYCKSRGECFHLASSRLTNDLEELLKIARKRSNIQSTILDECSPLCCPGRIAEQ